MPDPTTAYTVAIRAARSRGFALTRDAVRQIETAFRDAARTIEFDLDRATNPVTIQRGRALRSEIMGVLGELEVEATRTVNSAVRTTVADILAMHQRVVQRLAAQEGVTVVASLNRLDVRTLATLAARRGRAATFQTLVHRNIREAAPALDRLVNAAVVKGVPIKTLTRDVADLLATAEGADLATYGLGESAISGFRTLWSDAHRIASSETLNALRESQAQAMASSPLVSAVKWQTSGNHPLEDECDVLEQTDFYGFGEGFYPVEAWPTAPHPYCGCTQGEVQMRPVEDWESPRDPAPALAVSWEEFTPAVEGWSELRSERAVTTLRAALADPIGRRGSRAA